MMTQESHAFRRVECQDNVLAYWGSDDMPFRQAFAGHGHIVRPDGRNT